jgi:hypothetical protein
LRTRSEPIALAAALVTVLPAAAAASRSSASVSASQTIKFVVAFHDVEVDLGAGVCTFTSLTPPEAACYITFFLSGGEIATQFLNAPPPRKVAAIVGGTGAYRGARGEAVIVEGPKQTGTITFHLTG